MGSGTIFDVGVGGVCGRTVSHSHVGAPPLSLLQMTVYLPPEHWAPGLHDHSHLTDPSPAQEDPFHARGGGYAGMLLHLF